MLRKSIVRIAFIALVCTNFTTNASDRYRQPFYHRHGGGGYCHQTSSQPLTVYKRTNPSQDYKILCDAIHLYDMHNYEEAETLLSELFNKKTGKLLDDVSLSTQMKNAAIANYGLILFQCDSEANVRSIINVMEPIFDANARLTGNIRMPKAVQAMVISVFGISMARQCIIPHNKCIIPHNIDTTMLIRQAMKENERKAFEALECVFREPERNRAFNQLSRAHKGLTLSYYLDFVKRVTPLQYIDTLNDYMFKRNGIKYWRLLPLYKQIELINERLEVCSTSKDEAKVLKPFIIEQSSKLTLQGTPTPDTNNLVFYYYNILSDLSAKDRRDLPPVPIRFREYIFQRCLESGNHFYESPFIDIAKQNRVISNLRNIMFAIDHLNFSDTRRNRVIADDMSVLFDSQTGDFIAQVTRNRAAIIFNYGVVLNTLIGKANPRHFNGEKSENARMMIGALKYFFDGNKLHELTDLQQGQALFMYLSALNIRDDMHTYRQFAERSIFGDLGYIFRHSSLNQQVRVRLDYATYLENKGLHEDAAHILDYFISHPRGQRMISRRGDRHTIEAAYHRVSEKAQESERKEGTDATAISSTTSVTSSATSSVSIVAGHKNIKHRDIIKPAQNIQTKKEEERKEEFFQKEEPKKIDQLPIASPTPVHAGSIIGNEESDIEE